MRPLFILSGPVHTGKTTNLLHWLKEKKNVYGILAPVINGKRYLLDINTGEKKLLETNKDDYNSNVLRVGNYFFYKDVFDWGTNVILKAINQKPAWLVIDEFGPLELGDNGLEPAINKVINEDKLLANTNVIIIIRDNLMLDFIHKYIFSGIDLRWFFFD